jgi:hypothetical protein
MRNLFYPGGKIIPETDIFFIFPSDGRKIEQTWPDFRRWGGETAVKFVYTMRMDSDVLLQFWWVM